MAPIKLIDLPSQLLDKVVEALARVGIDLPALILQVFLLLLILLALSVAVRGLRPNWRRAKPLRLLSAGATALIAVGIVFGILSQFLLPDRLVGRVTGSELSVAKVELLDFRGQRVSTGGEADTETGQFIAYYSPAWNGRARTLRITSGACRPRELPIAPGDLTRGAETSWDYPCEKP